MGVYDFITKPHAPELADEKGDSTNLELIQTLEESINAPVEFTDWEQKTAGFEGGYHGDVYLDTEGFPTVGYGHKLSGEKHEELPADYKGQNVTEEEAMQMFKTDYSEKQQQLSKVFGGFDELPDQIKGVVTDLSFNVGTSKLLNAFPGFVSDIQSGDYSKAADQLKYKDPSLGDVEGNISQWWGQVGGSSTEEKVASGEWGESDLDINRATSIYATLKDFDIPEETTKPVETPAIEDTLINDWSMPGSIEF